MKSMFALVALAAFIGLTVGQCTFDPNVACAKCDFSRALVQYVANSCNCSEYWSCTTERGVVVAAQQQPCPPCLCFSNDVWTCSIPQAPAPGQVCPTQAPIVENVTRSNGVCSRSGNGPSGVYVQLYKAVSGDSTKFVWVISASISITLSCPPGTYFDFASSCQCIACVPGVSCALANSKVFCLDFDADAVAQAQGTYYSLGSASIVAGGIAGSNALLLNSPTAFVEINFFQMNQFSQFTLCGAFNRNSSSGSGAVGILSDGCFVSASSSQAAQSPSIEIWLSATNVLSATLRTQAGGLIILTGGIAVPDAWHTVCLTYDGSSASLYQDGSLAASASASAGQGGLTALNNCDLFIGVAFTAGNIAQSFSGELDNWCFYNTVQLLSVLSVKPQ